MIAAVRVRGTSGTKKSHKDALKSLNLRKKHNCMIYPEEKSIEGSLQKVKDHIAYGKINKDVLIDLIEKRSNFEELDIGDSEELCEKLLNNKVTIKDLREKGLNLPLRLSPPSKGFKDTEKQYSLGGTLGNQKENINKLLKKMI